MTIKNIITVRMLKRPCFYMFFIIISLHLFLFSTSSSAFTASDESKPAKTALILFDESDQWGWIGRLHSIFLANLLGHFHQNYRILAMNQYTEGLISKFDTIFYFGVLYNYPLPEAFIHDVLETKQDVVWFKYNLWQLNKGDERFTQQYGFQFETIDTTGYDSIVYKNTTLKKNHSDKELGIITLDDSGKAETFAVAQHSHDSEKSTPYIVHSQNLWYIADNPFSFAHENSPYLAFADILYDILHIQSESKKRALLRLEDIDPTYNPQLLKSIADYLYEQHIPFAISVIPYYQDPHHVYYNIQPFIKITEKPEFIDAIKYMISKNGTLILHGYTHQYSDLPNPYLGITGSDYEFARVILNPRTLKILSIKDIPEDSTAWVAERVTRAEDLLEQAGLKADFWETPHYIASDIDNRFFAEHFHTTVGRVEYYDSEHNAHHANQFFPYVIDQDMYGQKVIPENLGCVSPAPWFNDPVRNIQDILITAKKNLLLRDAWASVYYHPFLGLADLKVLVSEIKTLGYEFVSMKESTESDIG